MNQFTANARKLVPSLALGVTITLLGLLLNYLIFTYRVPAVVTGGKLPGREIGPPPDTVRRNPFLLFLRGFSDLTQSSDDFLSALMYRVRRSGGDDNTRDQIAIVAIDEASIARVGSWPWPRRVIADLIGKVEDAKVVGLDILLSDPDRTSLKNYIAQFDKLYGVKLDASAIEPEIIDNDLFLAEKVSQTRTVIGSLLSADAGTENRPQRMLGNVSLVINGPDGSPVDESKVMLKRAEQVIADLPILRDMDPPPLGEGFMNLFPSVSGSARSVPLFAHVLSEPAGEGAEPSWRVAPSFVLEIMRVVLEGDGYLLKLGEGAVDIPGFGPDGESTARRRVVDSVSITKSGAAGWVGDVLTIPLNEMGEMEIPIRRPGGDFRVYPAWEVLDNMHEGAFKDKIVLVGGTVDGIGYVVAAGLPDADLSAVETHALQLAAMVKGDFVVNSYGNEFFWQQIIILGSGLAVSLALLFGNIGLGISVSAATLLVILVGNYHFFFKRGIDIGVTLPLLTTLAVLSGQLIANYLILGRERRFIRRAFSLNVSPSILGYLESHPDRLSSLQGEHRDMTVLFTDIRGFTAISERMTPPDLARFLNEYFTPMSDIVMANMGTVDKFIGDALMAFWNAPADNPSHPQDAARSALAMQEKLAELQVGWTGRGLPRVAMGCGINSGPMFAGYMGSEQRKNYTVMGDNVNIASRLENLNKLYSSTILITESTRARLNNAFTCRVVDKVRVSGKEEAVMIYELLKEGPPGDEEYEEIASFARVFELYQEREFAAAESLLKELVFIRPTPLYRMYLDRLAIYMALPPPDDWDGTFSMSHK